MGIHINTVNAALFKCVAIQYPAIVGHHKFRLNAVQKKAYIALLERGFSLLENL
jgi:hypothetical protein